MSVKRILIIFVVCILHNCSSNVLENKEFTEEDKYNQYIPENIYVLKGQQPLDFETIDLNNYSQRISISDGTEGLISQAIMEYIVSLRDELPLQYQPYIGTIWIKESNHDVYFVIFQHVSGALNAKVVIRNNYSNLSETIDYNIHAMYSLKNAKLAKTDLMNSLFSGVPLIKIIKIDNDRSSLIELNRLYHNGTANLIENLVLKADSLNQIDTVSYSLDLIGDNQKR